MVELILFALLAALVVWLIDPFLGSLLHGFVGYAIARIIPGVVPRDLRGDWDAEFVKDNEVFVEHAHVKQLLDRVWGRILLPKKNRKYEFRGTIRGNVLVAQYDQYELRGSQAMDRGSFTLKLNNDGDKMVGRYSWTDDGTGEVNSDKYEWKKRLKA